MARPDASFWNGKRVLVTGHTGFKGSWLCAWLQELGADVSGFALNPETDPNLSDILDLELENDIRADLRDARAIKNTIDHVQPQIVLHLAAQALVRRGYREPVDTLATNIMGTANLLDALRDQDGLEAVLVVTSDKAYDNEDYDGLSDGDAPRRFVEGDRLGGKDPYSASKGGQELVARSFAFSYFEPNGIPVASARAGNVIGGGDWSEDRLMTDILNALANGDAVNLRNPLATRPWQHVLEPLAGYLLYAEKLAKGEIADRALNFGPDESFTVEKVTDLLLESWGDAQPWQQNGDTGPKEARSLEISADRAKESLGWLPRLDLETCLQVIVDWHQAHDRGDDMLALTRKQIDMYQQLMDH